MQRNVSTSCEVKDFNSISPRNNPQTQCSHVHIPLKHSNTHLCCLRVNRLDLKPGMERKETAPPSGRMRTDRSPCSHNVYSLLTVYRRFNKYKVEVPIRPDFSSPPIYNWDWPPETGLPPRWAPLLPQRPSSGPFSSVLWWYGPVNGGNINTEIHLNHFKFKMPLKTNFQWK